MPKISEHKRFLAKVNKIPRGCWGWMGGVIVGNGGSPYASFAHKKLDETIGTLGSRYSFTYYKGEIPKNLTIDHKCKNTICVNPKHLRAMTMRDNVLASDSASALNIAN